MSLYCDYMNFSTNPSQYMKQITRTKQIVQFAVDVKCKGEERASVCSSEIDTNSGNELDDSFDHFGF